MRISASVVVFCNFEYGTWGFCGDAYNYCMLTFGLGFKAFALDILA